MIFDGSYGDRDAITAEPPNLFPTNESQSYDLAVAFLGFLRMYKRLTAVFALAFIPP